MEACECEKFTGRLADICTGRADLPIATINKYRKLWTLDPLPDDGRTVTPVRLAGRGGGAVATDVETASRPAKARAPRAAKAAGCGCKAKPAKKTIVSRAIALAAATARHIADDRAPTPEVALEFRTSQCDGCPLRDGKECSKCGCYLYPNLLNKGKLQWRSEQCPAGKWFRQHDTYRPLVNPTRNLIFHIYPLRSATWNWHWHIDQIRRVAPLFNGKIAIGVVTGPDLAPPEEVQRLLQDVPVTDLVIKPNTRKLAETETFVDLLKLVKTDDPNTITFRGHTKGVTHARDAAEQPWARLMWATCMDLPSVDDALASHVLAGSMKCHEPLVMRKRGNFFYAGTYFWFRSDVFQRDWASFEETRWWPEYWPGQVADDAEAACLCHDYTKGSVLNNPYWHQEVAADFELWKSARPNRRIDLE